MNEPANEVPVVTENNPDKVLHEGVGAALNISPDSLKPEDNKPLEKIQETLKDFGDALAAQTGDESKKIRLVSGESWRERWARRILGQKKEQKAA